MSKMKHWWVVADGSKWTPPEPLPVGVSIIRGDDGLIAPDDSLIVRWQAPNRERAERPLRRLRLMPWHYRGGSEPAEYEPSPETVS